MPVLSTGIYTGLQPEVPHNFTLIFEAANLVPGFEWSSFVIFRLEKLWQNYKKREQRAD